MNTKSILLKLTAEGTDSARVWNGRKPFTVGHPIRWSLLREEDGVRITSYGKKTSEVWIQDSEIANGASLTLPSDVGEGFIQLEMRPVSLLPSLVATPSDGGSALRVFHCKGDWALDSAELKKNLVYRFENRKILSFKGKESGIYSPDDLIRIQAFADGILLKTADGNASAMRRGETRQFRQVEASGLVLEYGGTEWKLLAFQPSKEDPALAVAPARSEEDGVVRKSFYGALAALAALLLISFLLPQAEEEKKEEKIRIVLTPKKINGLMTAAPQGDPSAREFSMGKKGSAKNAGRKGGKVAKSAPKAAKVAAKPASKTVKKSATKVASQTPVKGSSKSKVQSRASRAAPVPQSELFKTFSSAAFKRVSSGVLTGGLTGGATGSDSASEARRMGSASGSGRGGLGSAGGVSTRSAEIYGMGGAGDGDGGPGSAGAGYGRGSHSKVSGQGRSFVSLDTGASDVDEGLTRDQVGRVIHAHMREIRYCHESAVLRDDGVEGRVTVNFSIGKNGAVGLARTGSSTVSSNRLENCIVSRLKAWQFPKPKGGVTVAVSYPFMFKMVR